MNATVQSAGKSLVAAMTAGMLVATPVLAEDLLTSTQTPVRTTSAVPSSTVAAAPTIRPSTPPTTQPAAASTTTPAQEGRERPTRSLLSAVPSQPEAQRLETISSFEAALRPASGDLAPHLVDAATQVPSSVLRDVVEKLAVSLPESADISALTEPLLPESAEKQSYPALHQGWCSQTYPGVLASDESLGEAYAKLRAQVRDTATADSCAYQDSHAQGYFYSQTHIQDAKFIKGAVQRSEAFTVGGDHGGVIYGGTLLIDTSVQEDLAPRIAQQHQFRLQISELIDTQDWAFEQLPAVGQWQQALYQHKTDDVYLAVRANAAGRLDFWFVNAAGAAALRAGEWQTDAATVDHTRVGLKLNPQTPVKITYETRETQLAESLEIDDPANSLRHVAFIPHAGAAVEQTPATTKPGALKVETTAVPLDPPIPGILEYNLQVANTEIGATQQIFKLYDVPQLSASAVVDRVAWVRKEEELPLQPNVSGRYLVAEPAQEFLTLAAGEVRDFHIRVYYHLTDTKQLACDAKDEHSGARNTALVHQFRTPTRVAKTLTAGVCADLDPDAPDTALVDPTAPGNPLREHATALRAASDVIVTQRVSIAPRRDPNNPNLGLVQFEATLKNPPNSDTVDFRYVTSYMQFPSTIRYRRLWITEHDAAGRQLASWERSPSLIDVTRPPSGRYRAVSLAERDYNFFTTRRLPANETRIFRINVTFDLPRYTKNPPAWYRCNGTEHNGFYTKGNYEWRDVGRLIFTRELGEPVACADVPNIPPNSELVVNKVDPEGRPIAVSEDWDYRIVAKNVPSDTALNGTEFPLRAAGLTSANNKTSGVVLPPGEYQLIETRAPFGFELAAEPIDFEVSLDRNNRAVLRLPNPSQAVSARVIANNNQRRMILEVADVHRGNIPKTGGLGVLWMILLGLVLVALAYWNHRRQQ
ncbi:SpaA isopeptide-forming pilin-related protein [Corynebacterium sp. HS2168-gen11]|uniref:prealbumin-like fold domain-containing protein n=1 Tax=Corynebacterium sp. HS2168-gen11 TaxID=2974027 RepID=UPI00216B3096|nr:SpaA isopeptide-forming pilin-related protein [Corynebacterium sp. HS2168-gen11]MCS4536429.1 SpaA isopeptide-forming pilin-related protein [Corynebacterium sp. HS2168-gen11]